MHDVFSETASAYDIAPLSPAIMVLHCVSHLILFPLHIHTNRLQSIIDTNLDIMRLIRYPRISPKVILLLALYAYRIPHTLIPIYIITVFSTMVAIFYKHNFRWATYIRSKLCIPYMLNIRQQETILMTPESVNIVAT